MRQTKQQRIDELEQIVKKQKQEIIRLDLKHETAKAEIDLLKSYKTEQRRSLTDIFGAWLESLRGEVLR